MKTPIIVASFALALSAVTLGTRLMEPSSDSRDVKPGAATAAGPGADFPARLAELSEENRELRARIATLELRPVSSERLPVAGDMDGFVSREELDSFRDEVLAALDQRVALGTLPIEESEAFREQVAESLSEIRRSESVAKALGGLEKRTAALDKTLPKIGSWLSLSPSQSNSMRSALQSRYEREAELLRRWESGEDSEVLGEIKRSDHEAHQAELASFLTVQQLQTYRTRGKDGR